MRIVLEFTAPCSCSATGGWEVNWHTGSTPENSRVEVKCLTCGRTMSVGFDRVELMVKRPSSAERAA